MRGLKIPEIVALDAHATLRTEIRNASWLERLTCEANTGHGPCGTYRDWIGGQCAAGHSIMLAEGRAA